MTDDHIVANLRGLGDDAFPPTPTLVEGVLAGIARHTIRRRRFVAGAGLAAAIIVAVLLIPAPRQAVARWLGIGGVVIEQVAGYELPSADRTAAPLGEETDLEDAARRVGFAPVVPDVDGLDHPVVYVRTDVAGGLVSLVYHNTPDTPGLIVTQFATAGEVAIKQLEPGVSFREVVIEGTQRGFWIEGGAHVIAFFGADGSLLEDSARLVGNTLVWQDAELTFRIESALSLPRVVELARSMRAEFDRLD